MTSFTMRQGGRNVLLAVFAMQTYGYGVGELGMIYAAMAGLDLILVAPSAQLADEAYKRFGDRRAVLVPSLGLGAVALSCVSLCGPEDHTLFLGSLAMWSVCTGIQGPALQSFAVDTAEAARPPLSSSPSPSSSLTRMSTDDDKTGQRTMGLALFRSSGDIGFVLAPLVLGACSGTCCEPASSSGASTTPPPPPPTNAPDHLDPALYLHQPLTKLAPNSYQTRTAFHRFTQMA